MLIKIISILCVSTIILGIIGVTIYMMRQQKKQHTPGLQAFAQTLNFIHHESEAEIRAISEQFTHLDFFRQGNKPRVRSLIQGTQGKAIVQVMIVTLTRSGVDQGFTDEYAAICIHQETLRLPHFKLQPKGYALERAINAITIGKEPQVSLDDYPALAKQYQLTSHQPEAAGQLFAQNLGDYLNNLTNQSRHRSLEGRDSLFFYYTYLKEAAQINDLQQLYDESLQVLNFLEQATIS